ncbi:MAG: DUF711 family protein [Firmicutes bacterium]|nr:DUF711 family protein [Bacillota bacterium]
MKIRTITTGISLQSSVDEDKIKKASEFNQNAKAFFEQNGYEVQEPRIASNSWEEYLHGLKDEEVVREIQKIEKICREQDAGFFNIGYAGTPSKIKIIPGIIKNTSITIFCSSKIGDVKSGINFENIKASAKAIKQISEETGNGCGNLRFCAWANCPPGIPFFPAAYHEGETSFSIGFECSDLVMKAFSKSTNLIEAEENLKAIFEEELGKAAELAEEVSRKYKIKYAGIDSSLAPSLDKNESIAFAYEKLGIGRFGHPGTLAISAVITRVLKSLEVKTCGYSGLMLPVCEDFGLVERASEGTYNLTDLLLYSAVCGCGLDTVPVPGDVPVETIEAILLDTAALAIKLDKPLSARLFPIPGKNAGEMTEFNSPYLIDCKILKV